MSRKTLQASGDGRQRTLAGAVRAPVALLSSSRVALRSGGPALVGPPAFVTPTLVSWDHELRYELQFGLQFLYVDMTAVTAGDACEIQWSLFDTTQGSTLTTAWTNPDQNTPHATANTSGVQPEFRANGLTLKLKWRWRVSGGDASEYITLLGESISVPRPPP